MIHLGDITKLNGAEIPPVDVITGGSPCQDLSLAGTRSGLAGERSGLFRDMVRVVKEMREHDRECGRTDDALRPRFVCWENVPGAFSSNEGRDFQAVLTEFIRIALPDAPDVPMPRGGKWPKAGCLHDLLGRFSLAWRLHDAIFWGVAQRRKRLSVVLDLGGLAAPEVLFERKGVCRDIEEGEGERKGSAARTGGGSGETGRGRCYRIGSFDSHGMRSANPHAGIYRTEAANALNAFDANPNKGQGGIAILQGCDIYNGVVTGESAVYLTTAPANGTGPRVLSFQERAGRPGGGKGILVQPEHTGALSTVNNQRVLSQRSGGGVMSVTKDSTATLRAQSHGHPPAVYCIGTGQSDISTHITKEASQTLNTLNARQLIYEADGSGT